MSLDFDTLQALRRQHPAWRRLQADSTALVASFLHRVFVLPNRRVISQSDLGEALEDTLFNLREQRGDRLYPKTAIEYLNDWAANDKAWLRKFYPPGTDEPHFNLTPATERAPAWLQTLGQRSFVGTESRLLTLFDLLRQMSEGSQTDVELRVQDLQRCRRLPRPAPAVRTAARSGRRARCRVEGISSTSLAWPLRRGARRMPIWKPN